uniref:Uncharacterized protein n=1 Tax=Romanomermis culicivorax TaxID=13658 RepID=A0A915JFY1_ROMCU
MPDILSIDGNKPRQKSFTYLEAMKNSYRSQSDTDNICIPASNNLPILWRLHPAPKQHLNTTSKGCSQATRDQWLPYY